MNKLLCLDFDGVIHSYTSPWTSPAEIRDDPVPGAGEFIVEASKHFTVCIQSSRSRDPDGVLAMQRYVKRLVDQATFEKIKWPVEKVAAFATIDDRALTFNGTWPDIQDILDFKPWNKRGV